MDKKAGWDFVVEFKLYVFQIGCVNHAMVSGGGPEDSVCHCKSAGC